MNQYICQGELVKWLEHATLCMPGMDLIPTLATLKYDKIITSPVLLAL